MDSALEESAPTRADTKFTLLRSAEESPRSPTVEHMLPTAPAVPNASTTVIHVLPAIAEEGMKEKLMMIKR